MVRNTLLIYKKYKRKFDMKTLYYIYIYIHTYIHIYNIYTLIQK